MISTNKMLLSLHAAGCSILDTASDEQIIQGYSVLKKLTETVDADVAELKKLYAEKSFDAFSKKINVIKDILANCCLRLLVSECEYLLESMQTGKTEVCEILLEKFASNFVSLTISFQMAEHTETNAPSIKKNQTIEALIRKIENAIKAFDEKSTLASLAELKKCRIDNTAGRIIAEMQEKVATFDFVQSEKMLVKLKKILAVSSNQKDVASETADIPIILAVDDRPDILHILKTVLSSNYRFFGVTSGEAALKFLETHKPDLFILDILMPHMNGFELASKIRTKTNKKPIIFLTGSSSREDIFRALSLGAADFIVKPLNDAVVLKKIEVILANR